MVTAKVTNKKKKKETPTLSKIASLPLKVLDRKLQERYDKEMAKPGTKPEFPLALPPNAIDITGRVDTGGASSMTGVIDKPQPGEPGFEFQGSRQAKAGEGTEDKTKSSVMIDGKSYVVPKEMALRMSQEVGVLSEEEQAIQQQQEQEILGIEKQQAIAEEESPERRSLAPEDIPGSPGSIPVFGGILSAGINTIQDEARKGRFGETIKNYMAKGQIIKPEELRTAVLTQIEKEVYEEGLTGSERFGAWVEGIPVVGSLVGTYVTGLTEDPYGNIQTLRTGLNQETRRATKYETWARSGAISPEVAVKNIDEISLNVQRMESRIKLLINFSPRLRFDSDQINVIETQILRLKEILLESKLRASLGMEAPPNDYALASVLEELDAME